jgi:hypothetical protein
MVLLMSRPHKHPKTGIYWFRKRVPSDLLALVGRNEVTESLDTRDPAEAKTRYAEVLQKHEARWANLREGARDLTEREAHGIAAAFFEKWVALHQDNPSAETLWHPGHYKELWTFEPLLEDEARPGETGTRPVENIIVPAMGRFCLVQADDALENFGHENTYWNRLITARAIAAAMQRAHFALQRQAEGLFDPGETLSSTEAVPRNPANSADRRAPKPPGKGKGSNGGTPLTELVEGWWREAQATGRKPSTYESYRNTFAGLIKFLGHDDAQRVRPSPGLNLTLHKLPYEGAARLRSSSLRN